MRLNIKILCFLAVVAYSWEAHASLCTIVRSGLNQEHKLTRTRNTPDSQGTEYSSGLNITLSVSCALGKPNVAVVWDGLDPDDAFYDMVGTAGNLLTHRPVSEVVKYSKQCRQEALKDDSEIATIEREGMAIECQAFKRDGGGTTITIFTE